MCGGPTRRDSSETGRRIPIQGSKEFEWVQKAGVRSLVRSKQATHRLGRVCY